MERLCKVKRILDSVHGQIKIPKEWCEKIIDTSIFQRLRRIEQNSCRTVYPSARHDRFIHSLGVYHIGTLIAKHLEEECRIPEFDYSILKTYRLACLLHDVGHTPFSHTFEVYFDEKDIRSALEDALKNESFSSDLKARKNKLTEHELLSAYVAIKEYRGKLSDDDQINWPLLARMIIGLPFIDGANDQRDNSRFENIMIDLIHGTIDADGLDYVCRDVWAGGYRNFSIDLQRLIDSIHVSVDSGGYQLSFSANALNEIEGVLNVKNFQNLYVFNHHKVQLEQYYLVEAMKTAATFHMEIEDRDEALKKLCNYHAFLEEIKLPKLDYSLYRPCDDDFVALMKQTIPKDIYINGWFDRNFSHKPLWKSKMHFFYCFIDVFYKINIPIKDQKQNNSDSYLKRVRESRVNAICEAKCKDYVAQELKLDSNDIFQVSIQTKIRRINPDEILVSLGDSVRKFSELTHDTFTVKGDLSKFCYWYVNLTKLKGDSDEDKRKRIIDIIKKYASTVLFLGVFLSL